MGVKTLAEKKKQEDRVAGFWYLGLSSFIFEAGKDVDRLFGLSCVCFFCIIFRYTTSALFLREDNGLDVGWGFFFPKSGVFFFFPPLAPLV